MTLFATALLIATNATPAQIVYACRGMIPANVELHGRINLRDRRGISIAEHGYELSRSNGVSRLAVDGEMLSPDPSGTSGQILGTDVTWSDLSLEYLWWDDFSFDGEKDGESVHGQKCAVVAMRRGGRTVRLWIDRKTGALMQAEEVKDGKSIRRLWGARIKKFGDRWMANVMEVETFGSGHRTKITVDDLKIPSKEDAR